MGEGEGERGERGRVGEETREGERERGKRQGEVGEREDEREGERERGSERDFRSNPALNFYPGIRSSLLCSLASGQ